MYRIAAVGDKDSIYGFSALGMEIYPIDNINEAKITLKKLVNDNTAIIYVTESIAEELYDEISGLISDSIVSIIPIPGLHGNTGVGMKNVKLSVEKAVGSDILFS